MGGAMETTGLAERLAAAARQINVPHQGDTLDAIVRITCQALPEVDHVGVAIAHRDGVIETRAASDDVAARLDRLQQELREGPLLTAVDSPVAIQVDRASAPATWPRFFAVAHEIGVRSQLYIPLRVAAPTRGILVLTSGRVDRLSDETSALGEIFGAHAALALGQSGQVANLRASLVTRKTIGLGLGIVMQRLDLDEDGAFAYLSRVAERTQTKVRGVAATVVSDHERRLADVRRVAAGLELSALPREGP